MLHAKNEIEDIARRIQSELFMADICKVSR